MELKEATYKTTELGLIPEDWSITTLSKVGSFSKGKGIKKDEVQTDGIPCVRYGELYTKYDNIITFFHSYISEEFAASSIQIKEGDILFAGSGETRAEIGKCAAMLYADRVFAGGDIVVLRPNNFDSTFLGYLLNAPIIAKQKSIKGQGDAVVHIYSSGLANVKIPVPPPAEQKAIATALSDVDTLITNLDKLIAKKKAIKQGAMQRLLKSPAQGGQRLPGFEGEWVENKLLGLLKEKPSYGINAPAVEFNLELPCYLRITDISDTGEYIDSNKVSVKHSESDSFILIDGDLVLARTGASVGKSYLYNPNDGLLVYAGFLIKLSPEPKKLNPLYLKFYLQTRQYWNWVTVMSMRSGQPGINGNEYGTLIIPLPPTLEEQNQIASILSDMNKEIESLETKKSKYLRIKQGMMQELLTGKTRLV